ncbi:MAG: hypothetical protein A3A33_01545 [Candidatus Yanofskybacteria bacterium RIFCSPLOWO2_01_FULL_49_25]|uniref:Uncharacterized protein n=1 Tax=Candidatus Yanofskybacteria bacterium RIFCSPLOWO2_01_FULL_49_25 TaxID=1802701 RepID=A0A1F8GZB4_9BACT|nr:MAG: hypothetical protein A3A33_01545 [Candidatus Yanofskybacteria bacterium RIFCSPLOWO2_01_FULL_49_25]
MSDIQKGQFSFGKNWQAYLRNLTEERQARARKSLTDFMSLADLKGKSFLDIGCGSGLFSKAAFDLGATAVTSIDRDPFSVACCQYLYEQSGSPANWTIREMSILDEKIRTLGRFDIVYAWGVLHHTGSMWEALEQTISLVAPGGRLYIAIYNRIPGRMGSLLWLRIKRWYNVSPRPVKLIMEWLYIAGFCFKNLVRFKNPWKKMRQHSSKRGMDWRRDVSDWLGGYPYEFATVDEIFMRVKDTHPDLNLINLKSVQDLGNNWFVFERTK